MTGPNLEPQVTEPPFPEKVQWCLDNLGQRISAVAAGVSDARPVRAWATGEMPAPETAQQRIGVLYAAAVEVVEVYDDQTARAFFRSSNPYAGDLSLLEVIAAEGSEAQETVRGAVSLFLE